tara:strand:- start:142 stop:417 length:276 start_codon:yes stop_codon:yes gene_type:complete
LQDKTKMLKTKNEKQLNSQENSESALESKIYNQSLRVDTLKMAMTVLDARVKREVENQMLLPTGRQTNVDSYSVEELIVEANKILDFVTSD